jgi:hypothetical protein
MRVFRGRINYLVSCGAFEPHASTPSFLQARLSVIVLGWEEADGASE